MAVPRTVLTGALIQAPLKSVVAGWLSQTVSEQYFMARYNFGVFFTNLVVSDTRW